MTPHRRRLSRSLTLRLGLIYVSLFLTSTAAMFGAFYWFGVHEPLTRQAALVQREADRLAGVDRANGREALIGALEARRATGPRRAFDTLVDAGGAVRLSNIPSWPNRPIKGWVRLDADISRAGQELDYKALVVERRLNDGARLIVGRDIEDIDGRSELFTLGAAWLVLLAGLLAIGGSILASRAVGRRIDVVTQTAQRVMAGELTERIPLRGTGDDFDELGEALNLMLGRIQESVDAVRRVSDNIAHELRTPLARLRVDLDELSAADNMNDQRRLAEQAIAEAERLQSIFDALLRIARIESGRHLAGVKTVDVSTLLADAVELHMPSAEARGQRIAVEIAPSLALEADPNLLFQAVSNLLDNAIKYGGDGGRVNVAALDDGDSLSIEVSDEGPGIAAPFREKVKERFFRLPETSGQPGTGLGLALVAAIVELHKGSLHIEDAEPGTVVRILLPRPMR